MGSILCLINDESFNFLPNRKRAQKGQEDIYSMNIFNTNSALENLEIQPRFSNYNILRSLNKKFEQVPSHMRTMTDKIDSIPSECIFKVILGRSAMLIQELFISYFNHFNINPTRSALKILLFWIWQFASRSSMISL
jgi:hypothetical protein